MLLSIVLGIMIGAAGVTLFRQWSRDAFDRAQARPVMTPAVFPRLAPSRRAAQYSPRLWHRAA